MNPPEKTVILKLRGDELSQVLICAECEAEELVIKRALRRILKSKSQDWTNGK